MASSDAPLSPRGKARWKGDRLKIRRSAEERFSGNRSPEVQKLIEWLSDGKWHDFDPLLKRMVPLIPPGQAWRHVEKARLHNKRSHARKTLSPDEYEQWIADPENMKRDSYRGLQTQREQVESGQWGLARERIGTQIRNGRIERRVLEDGRVQIRLRDFHPHYSQSVPSQIRREWTAEGREFTDLEVTREAGRRNHARRKDDPEYLAKRARWEQDRRDRKLAARRDAQQQAENQPPSDG